MIARNKRLFVILSIATALLIAPLVGMLFTNEVNWSAFDFLVAGTLLLGTGLVIEMVLRKVKDRTKRIIICLAVLLVLFLIWAELAVGLFGTPFAGS